MSSIPLTDDMQITMTVGQLRAIVEEVRGGGEERPAVDDEELLVHLWREEATRNLLRAEPWEENGSSGGTRKGGRA